MTTRARRGRPARGRAPKRKAVWIDTFVSGAAANGAQIDFNLLTALGANDIPGLTLTRTIVDLSCGAATGGGANGRMRVDVGIGVIQAEAQAANVFADPQTALDFPLRGWVLRKHWIVTDSVDSFDRDFQRMELDLKSRRALHTADSELFLIANNAFESGTGFTIDLQGWIRCLFLMP